MPDPEQTPTPQEAAVRRLLAEARHDEPMPPEVAARLETLVGRLAEERAGRPVVTDPAVRRHRNRVVVFAAAAAVAVVVGTGGAITRLVVDDGPGSSADSSASQAGGSQAEDSQAEDSQAQQQSSPGSEAGSSDAQAAPAAAPPVTLTAAGLEAEVRAALAPPTSGGAYDSRLYLTFDDCGPPAGTPYDVVLPATYDGRDGVLAATAESAGGRRVDVFLCGATEPVRSLTLAERR